MERLLPNNIEAERAVLGSVLLDNRVFAQAYDSVRADDFSLSSHRTLYARMHNLYSSGRPIDLVTLGDELSKHKEVESVGGIAYLSSLTDGLPRCENISHYVAILREKNLKRRIVLESEALQKAAANGSTPSELAQRILQMAEGLQAAGISGAVNIPDPLEFPAAEDKWDIDGLIFTSGNRVRFACSWQLLSMRPTRGMRLATTLQYKKLSGKPNGQS